MVGERDVRILGITAAAVSTIALMLFMFGLFDAPGASAGPSRHCSIIVTKSGKGLTSASVTVVQGRTDCEHARRVLYKAFATKPYREREIEGWNCTSTLSGNGVFGATCETEGEKVHREVIKTSRPKACSWCHKPRD